MEHSDLLSEIEISYDVPSQCADKLLSGQADIGLIPIVETLRMPESYIVSDLCIGAKGAVKTVILASNIPISQVTKVYMDHHSRTSVALAKILAKHHWHIQPQWVQPENGIIESLKEKDAAAVIIGDKAFDVKAPYIYDLASEWQDFTGLPFVFACWVANKKLDSEFLQRFNRAMSSVFTDMEQIVSYYRSQVAPHIDLLDYYTHYISYELDEEKRKGLELFLQYAKNSIGS